MRGADPGTGHREELLERFDLDPTKKGRAYSKGNRQKVALVAAFSADVDLLVLDEPTSGLDPLMEQVFNDCVAERVRRGHHGPALQPHPQRGRAAGATGSRSSARAGGGVGDPRRAPPPAPQPDPRQPSQRVPDRLDAIPGVHDLSVEDHTLTCTVEPEALPQVLQRLTQSGVTALTSAPPTLEELFLDALPEPVMTERYAGTLLVARAALRRDRLLVTIWVALLRPHGLRVGRRDRHALRVDRRPGGRRASDQRQPGRGRALRADPRRAQPGRAGDDQGDGAVRRDPGPDVRGRRPPAHPQRGGVRPRRAARRHRDRPGRRCWPRPWSRASPSPWASAPWSPSRPSPVGYRSPGRSGSVRPGWGPVWSRWRSTALCCQLAASSRTCFGHRRRGPCRPLPDARRGGRRRRSG